MLRHRFLVLLTLRWFQTGLQLPVLILLLRARGLDLTSVGVVVATYSLTTAALELPTGGLADVIGRRQVLIAASVAFVAESLTFGLGQDLAVLPWPLGWAVWPGRWTPVRSRPGSSTRCTTPRLTRT